MRLAGYDHALSMLSGELNRLAALLRCQDLLLLTGLLKRHQDLASNNCTSAHLTSVRCQCQLLHLNLWLNVLKDMLHLAGLRVHDLYNLRDSVRLSRGSSVEQRPLRSILHQHYLRLLSRVVVGCDRPHNVRVSDHHLSVAGLHILNWIRLGDDLRLMGQNGGRLDLLLRNYRSWLNDASSLAYVHLLRLDLYLMLYVRRLQTSRLLDDGLLAACILRRLSASGGHCCLVALSPAGITHAHLNRLCLSEMDWWWRNCQRRRWCEYRQLQLKSATTGWQH